MFYYDPYRAFNRQTDGYGQIALEFHKDPERINSKDLPDYFERNYKININSFGSGYCSVDKCGTTQKTKRGNYSMRLMMNYHQ